MSGTGETSDVFAGEERQFRIRLGEVRKIEAKCATGVGEVLRRLSRAVHITTALSGIEALSAGMEIHADDVRETIYQGLVGAGMPQPEAFRLVKLEIDDRGVPGLFEHLGLALAVLWGAHEVPDTGERKPEGSAATPPSGSTSRKSTARARRSASPRATSTS